MALYDALVKGANEKELCLECAACKYKGPPESCYCACGMALVDTLQDIALAAGFDLKKVEGGE